MKTQIITIFTAIVLVTGIAANSNAATVKDETATVLTDVSDISKIEVRGNVQLYISNGPADEVKVYNKYYAESALVKSRKGVLSIASYKAEKLVVWVTAADLRSISVYDNADVKSFGDLSAIELNVDLHNNATANLNLDAFNATVAVYDHAKASLSGKVDQYTTKYNKAENISYVNFDAAHISKSESNIITKAQNDDLVGL